MLLSEEESETKIQNERVFHDQHRVRHRLDNTQPQEPHQVVDPREHHHHGRSGHLQQNPNQYVRCGVLTVRTS